MPRSWHTVSFTNSPRTWKIRMHVEEEGRQPSDHDLPWSFATEEEAEEEIKEWKKALHKREGDRGR